MRVVDEFNLTASRRIPLCPPSAPSFLCCRAPGVVRAPFPVCISDKGISSRHEVSTTSRSAGRSSICCVFHSAALFYIISVESYHVLELGLRLRRPRQEAWTIPSTDVVPRGEVQFQGLWEPMCGFFRLSPDEFAKVFQRQDGRWRSNIGKWSAEEVL